MVYENIKMKLRNFGLTNLHSLATLFGCNRLRFYTEALKTKDWETYEKKKLALARLKKRRWQHFAETLRKRDHVEKVLRNLVITQETVEEYSKRVDYPVEIIPSKYPVIYEHIYGGGTRTGEYCSLDGLEEYMVEQGIEALTHARAIERPLGIFRTKAFLGIPVRKKR